MDSGEGMSYGGHSQILPQCGEFSTNIGGETMVHCRGICTTKQHASCELRGAGAEIRFKGIRDDLDGGS